MDRFWKYQVRYRLARRLIHIGLFVMPPGRYKAAAEKHYNYNDCNGKCLYGLYMASHGVEWDESGAVSGLGDRSDFCLDVYSKVAASWPWTFGGALNRARRASPFVPLSPQDSGS